MSECDIKQLGNVPAKYTFSLGRTVNPLGPIFTPRAALKTYNMIQPGRGDLDDEVRLRCSRKFIKDALDERIINPELGLGFVIFSDADNPRHGYINALLWGAKDPIILKQHLFHVDTTLHEDDVVQPLDIAKEGSCCLWEGILIGHESRAWRRYLSSDRREPDKRTYLGADYQGSL